TATGATGTTPASRRPCKVLRFDGASLATGPRILNVCEIVRLVSNTHQVVVVAEGLVIPTLGSTRSRLLNAARLALATRNSPHRRYVGLVAQLERDHLQIIRKTVKNAEAGEAAERDVLVWCHEIRELLGAIQVIGEVPIRTRDTLISYGEKLSARAVSATLESMGIPSTFIDIDAISMPPESLKSLDSFYSEVGDRLVALIEAALTDDVVPVIP
ncbi:Aspartokinase, partial [Irineochytrium annulatum]